MGKSPRKHTVRTKHPRYNVPSYERGSGRIREMRSYQAQGYRTTESYPEVVGTIRDLQDRSDLTLVTDSQDVRSVFDLLEIRVPKSVRSYIDGLFVKTGEGEYTEVYGFEGAVPELYKPVYRIYPVK